MRMDDQFEENQMGVYSLIETLYQQYLSNPSQVDLSWKKYFDALLPKKEIKTERIEGVFLLIQAYRYYGHLLANLNPIALKKTEAVSELNLDNFGFNHNDLNRIVPTEGILSKPEAPLGELIERLKILYCGTIGFELEGLPAPLQNWIQDRVETGNFLDPLDSDQSLLILNFLNRSELFENFLHTKYVGQKRFSIEGAETLIPMLAFMLEKGAEDQVEECVIGMAHRGRLNVLANILKKSFDEILREFDEGYIPDPTEGKGDVKYHKGYSGNYLAVNGRSIKVTLPPNPSHLESVSPVVEGQTRGKQFILKDTNRNKIIPILIHGDAALSGQGVVYETLQLSQLSGYSTGGTIHFVINNQIGFTTIPRDSRSTHYCTDIARAFGMPVFHVNAEDPEACIKVTLMAFQIRQRFKCDVFIDIHCYRKYGHNEGDEPAFTQPHEYKIIKRKKPIREIYHDYLLHKKTVSRELIDQLENDFKEGLNQAYEKSRDKSASPRSSSLNRSLFEEVKTGVSEDLLVEAAHKMSRIPEGFTLHPKVKVLVNERLETVKEKKLIDWGLAETLAYATLLIEGKSVRLSGQDCGRGTFSHRHALWVDQEKEYEYFPLNHLQDLQGQFEVINSSLSEMGVLGFEYGYSVANPEGLTIWEAQFGDFSNGAQIIIDQYIVSAETKWGQKSNLVMLLPHGYEGQGPEHSSARIERYLSMAADCNVIVANPSTPAQLFHLLRRQVHWEISKPLVIFSPKALLRLPSCKSPTRDFENGFFQTILDDESSNKTINKIILCSGKIYYDLVNRRKNGEAIAIIRIEQLFPLDEHRLMKIIQGYPNAKEIFWVQEEPLNMGAGPYLDRILRNLLSDPKWKYSCIGREESSSPATGSQYYHRQEQETLLNQVFNNEK